MPKPSDLFKWATAGGAVLEPAEDEKEAGFANGVRPPARWHNWLFNGAHKWFSYLNNLHAEADFVDEDFEWGGEHTFTKPTEFTDDVEVNAPLICQNHISGVGVVATDHFYLTTLGGEVLYADGPGEPAPIPRTERIRLSSGYLLGNAGGAIHAILQADGDYWAWLTSGPVGFPLALPSGAIITGMRAAFNNPGGGSILVDLDLRGKTPNHTPPYTSTSSLLFGGPSVSVGASAGALVSRTPGAPFVLERSVADHTLVVSCDAAPGRLYWIEVDWLDPGPRNY